MSGDTTIVESHAPQWAEGMGWKVGGDPLLEIGREDGPEAYTFERIDQLLPLPRGGWLVADGGVRQLRLFDNAGVHYRTIGREGRGPGEFRTLSGVLITADTIFALDSGSQRLSVFTSTGRLLETIDFESTTDPYFPLWLYSLAGRVGSDWVLMARSWPADMRPEPVAYWDAGATFLYTADGRRKATIAEPSGLDTYSTPTRAGAVIFGRASSGAVASETVVMTDGGEPEFRVYSPPDSSVRIVRWARSRVQADPNKVSDLRQLHAAIGGSAKPEWAAAEYYPAVTNLLVDSEGFTWAEEWTDPQAASRTWQVFSKDGPWLGAVSVPGAFRAEVIGQAFVAGVWHDKLTGVQTIRIYALRREARGR